MAMQQGAQQLLLTLADAGWHSGERLAQQLSVSRVTVNNYAKQLVAAGFPLESKSRLGYRLQAYPEVLNAEALAAAVQLPVHVVATAASTNDMALAHLKQPDAGPAVFVAEHQSAGRGRRGRVWQAKPGEALLYSLAWPFDRLPPDLPALSLVVASVLVEALTDLGLSKGLGIKWPNDLLLNQHKLAGVLVEAVLREEQAAVVVGVGLNMQSSPKAETRYPATSLAEHGVDLSRATVIEALTTRLQAALALFADQGFAAFHAAYMQHDIVVGQRLDLDQQQLLIQSIDSSGALVAAAVDADTDAPNGELKRYVSGELSLPWPSC